MQKRIRCYKSSRFFKFHLFVVFHLTYNTLQFATYTLKHALHIHLYLQNTTIFPLNCIYTPRVQVHWDWNRNQDSKNYRNVQKQQTAVVRSRGKTFSHSTPERAISPSDHQHHYITTTAAAINQQLQWQLLKLKVFMCALELSFSYYYTYHSISIVFTDYIHHHGIHAYIYMWFNIN